jgi:TldD protein
LDLATVEQLAQDAVAQAKVNARGTPRTVDLESIPTAVGHWTMPVRIDPFTVPIEEKLGFMRSWNSIAKQCGAYIDELGSYLYCARQERVVATSEGSHFTQTVYETGGKIVVGDKREKLRIPVHGLTAAGKGWELFLDANIPEQIRSSRDRFAAEAAALANPKPANVGRYTLVCDGATMATILDHTIGRATQIDRALGYEANASGTSFLNDPLAMLGTFKVASPLVTVTANRTTPGQLATVKWDDEGVEPQPFTLVNQGILDDFQTTREQATWLAPYYQRMGRPVRSHGCAASEDAGFITMQHMPNLALTANTAAVDLDHLVADVKDGILVTDAHTQVDFQSRTGLLAGGKMHEIKNGRVGRPLVGGAIMYDTLDFWNHVTALGGAATQSIVASTRLPKAAFFPLPDLVKGQPPQSVSYSVQGAAATITQQALINPRRKA